MSDNQKRPFLTEAGWNAIKERYAKCRAGLSAAFYAIMVFVVIFGLSQNVYAGFPAPVPYLIIALFLLMAFVRLYESLVSDQLAAGKKKKAAQQKNRNSSPTVHRNKSNQPPSRKAGQNGKKKKK